MHALMTQVDWQQPVVQQSAAVREVSPVVREEIVMEDAERWDGLY